MLDPVDESDRPFDLRTPILSVQNIHKTTWSESWGTRPFKHHRSWERQDRRSFRGMTDESWRILVASYRLKTAIWIGVSEGTHLPLSTTSFNRDQPQLWDHASQFNNSGSNLKIWNAWDCPARPFHQTFATPQAFGSVINWCFWICGCKARLKERIVSPGIIFNMRKASPTAAFLHEPQTVTSSWSTMSKPRCKASLGNHIKVVACNVCGSWNPTGYWIVF